MSISIQIEPTELAQALQSEYQPKLLDVREPDEHAIVHLPGAKLIPLGQLAERMNELAPWRETPIVVYCHHGIRSLHAIGQLRAAGFTQLQNLAGGIDRWSMEVQPLLPRY